MTNGIRLFHSGGSGPNLLLLHGFGADRMTWLTNQEPLQQSSSVFVCDLPAHGDQPPLAENITISKIVDELIKPLDSRGERFVLVGHSLGGAIALELAARRPDLVTAMALLAPAGLGKGIDRDFLDGFSILSDMDSALALLRRLVARPRLITPHIAQRVIEHLGQAGVRSAMQVLGDQLVQVETSIRPHAVSVAVSKIPRMVIWGEEDQINPIDRAKLALFNSQVIAMPDTGHLPHIEASKSVNRYLTEFLRTSRNEVAV